MSNVYQLGQILLSASGIMLVYFLIIRRQQAEACRFEMRRLRDQLFDFMWVNGHDYSEMSYIKTRQQINDMLRLTTTIGPFSLLVTTYRFWKIVDHLPKPTYTGDASVNEKCRQVREEVARRFVQYALLTGPIGATLRMLSMMMQAKGRARTFKSRVMEKAEVISDAMVRLPQFVMIPGHSPA